MELLHSCQIEQLCDLKGRSYTFCVIEICDYTLFCRANCIMLRHSNHWKIHKWITANNLIACGTYCTSYDHSLHRLRAHSSVHSVSCFLCKLSPKYLLFLFVIFFPVMVGVDFFAWISLEHWQTASQMLNSERCARQCDRLHRESVARLTVNIPVKSDICFQSSPPGSLQQLPWKPQCDFPPLFGLLDILKAFSDSWFIKACIHHQWMGACFVQFLDVCIDYRYSVCTCVYMRILRLTFTADVDVNWVYAALNQNKFIIAQFWCDMYSLQFCPVCTACSEFFFLIQKLQYTA